VLVRSPSDLGQAIRARRKQLGLDQRALAQQVGVSRQWIVEIEKGKARAELGLVLRTLKTLELRLEVDSPPPGSAQRRVPGVDLDAVIDRARGK
jgi:HTH-type transcriptional regulator/antitoxin HipB